MAARAELTVNPSITFSLNGQSVQAADGESILQVAERNGIPIPRLCYMEGMRAVGNCRSCMVEIDGERVLAPSCCRYPTEGMQVRSDSERALTSQKMVVELLASDKSEESFSRTSELDYWEEHLQIGTPRFERREQPPADLSHPAMAVNLADCIQCTRCVRACREVQVNDVIGYAYRGAESAIVFDFNDPMGDSTCVACGECIQACPTGALMPAKGVAMQVPDKEVESVCPYCGVGCLLTYHVKDNHILWTDGRDGPANHSRLCVKGRYGFDYAHHPERLTEPLIRREDVPKRAELDFDPANPYAIFRPATWEEALERATRPLRQIRDEHGHRALAGFGCAKGSNEEAYLFQKLVRTGFGSNNVDHCTRLCHASSVFAMLEAMGSGAVSNPVEDVALTDVMLIIGANPTENHPVAATFMKNAVKDGKTLIVADPRRNGMTRYAKYILQTKPDSDVALLNGMMHVIIEEGLVNEQFINERTEGYEALKEHLLDYSPETVAPICGIPAETIREVARVYATASASMIFWGMGISQHSHGTDNARALISLAMITGQVGRPGTGLHPLRGQNNVQGASDVGLIPMVYADYQPVDDESVRRFFEELWGQPLDPEPGLTVVEIMHAAVAGKIRGIYIMGENPAMSDPNVNHARQALVGLEHLVVQDIFLTETAYYADVVLPASVFQEKTGTYTNTDRRVQMGRKALDLPGDARQDLWIIQEMAKRLGCNWHYDGPREVFEEMRQAMPSIAGMTWERLEREDSISYPCEKEGDPGEQVIFIDDFPTSSGRANLVPASYTGAEELPDKSYPYVLITGRQLEHWHTGAMTRRASVLDALEPSPVASMHPADLERLNVQPGNYMTLSSRRGEVVVAARADNNVGEGHVFLPFCYHEAAANLLTNEALDPDAKIPEYKYCAVHVKAMAEAYEAKA